MISWTNVLTVINRDSAPLNELSKEIETGTILGRHMAGICKNYTKVCSYDMRTDIVKPHNRL